MVVEFLNNYASDQNYGQTQDGMAWGLEGLQLSNLYKAAILKQEGATFITWLINNLGWLVGFNNVEDMANEAFSQIDTYYDFYIHRDVVNLTSDQQDGLMVRDYSGLEFNKEIKAYLKSKYASNSNAKIDYIELNESPQSAFAYCYNKNKRNSNGEVSEIKWYLPAIDEIEDIAKGAYDEFDKVFQNEKYWSCQPAYELRDMNIELGYNAWGWNSEGYLKSDYYVDDLDRARATSVYTSNGNSYTNINSGVPGYAGVQNGRGTLGWGKITFDLTKNGGYISNNISDFTSTPGNLPRKQHCRIRAVYRSGTK